MTDTRAQCDGEGRPAKEAASERSEASVKGSSAFAKATADIAVALAEACRGAKPLGVISRYE